MCIFVFVFFFFFQAEDGIRDIGVTGVQTCALPIYTETNDWKTAFSNVIPSRKLGTAKTSKNDEIGNRNKLQDNSLFTNDDNLFTNDNNSIDNGNVS